MKCYKLHFVHRDGILFYIERVSEKVGLFCGKLCYFLMVDKTKYRYRQEGKMVERSFRLFWVANFAPYLDFLFFFFTQSASSIIDFFI